MKFKDRDALRQWEELRANVERNTPIVKETEAERAKRRKRLDANHDEWFKFYFPNYYSSNPAKFHVNATKRIMDNARWYEVRAWSRELAKSVRSMMEATKLAMMGAVKNVLIVSNSHDSAERLLKPYLLNFEGNQRLIRDYGRQMNPGHWEKDEFTTLSGVSFRAIGAGESPRGTRNESFRPDLIIIDDIDTDKECRNPIIIKNKWNWIEQALIPTVSVSGKYRIIFNGNIIARDCCITRAIKKADHVDIINIRDKNGKSSWPEKNSEADINKILSLISFASAQKEYFNNPVIEGTTFKDIIWDKCPPLHMLRAVVVYGDPAPSNKENKNNCYKFVGLVGQLDGKFYVYNCKLEHVKNHEFVRWYYDMEEYVGGKTQIYNYIENNSLQDPFYEQVFLPLFAQAGKDYGHYIHVRPDERKKPEKYARIEGNLEPLNRRGGLIFNIDQKANPHMLRLEEQFKAVEPTLSAPIDGPDGTEGAVYILNQQTALSGAEIHTSKRSSMKNNKRF